MSDRKSRDYRGVLGIALIVVGVLIAVMFTFMIATDFNFGALVGIILGMIIFFTGVAFVWRDRSTSPE
jgi:hypothetical protein